VTAPAVEHLGRAAAASRATASRLPEARRAAADAIGVPQHGSNVFSRAWDRVQGWIGDALRWLIHLVNLPSIGLGGGGSVLALIIRLLTYLVIASIVIGVVVLVARALFGWKPRPRRSRYTKPEGPPPTPFEEARAHALGLARSDPREGLRLLYTALLQELGRRRGWRPLPGRSNWTFVRRLDPRSDPGAALAECTRLFEGRVYGSTPAAEPDVRRVSELADTVLA
jgi:Domain of unknown function (DUF4129)